MAGAKNMVSSSGWAVTNSAQASWSGESAMAPVQAAGGAAAATAGGDRWGAGVSSDRVVVPSSCSSRGGGQGRCTLAG